MVRKFILTLLLSLLLSACTEKHSPPPSDTDSSQASNYNQQNWYW